MYDWFDCPCRVAVLSQSISRAAENSLAFLHLKAVVQNASLEAELLSLTWLYRLGP